MSTQPRKAKQGDIKTMRVACVRVEMTGAPEHVRSRALTVLAGERCCYCGAPAGGNYAIHRFADMTGDELPLCDQCGGYPVPTCSEIWEYLAKQE